MSQEQIASILLAALVAFWLYRSFAGKVAPAEARRLVGAGARLLDVRTSGEFAGGHLPGALNVPVGDLADRLGELDPRRPTVVYCQSGMRSASAARLLRKSGFREVHDLGAMARWG